METTVCDYNSNLRRYMRAVWLTFWQLILLYSMLTMNHVLDQQQVVNCEVSWGNVLLKGVM